MDFYPPHCPNALCECNPTDDYFYWRRYGTFYSKAHARKIQRFHCLRCDRKFSELSFSSTLGQHRPRLNMEIYARICSGESQRAIARNIGTTPATVQKKIAWLAEQAKLLHSIHLASGALDTSCIQIDEQETFIETPAKPVGVTYVVRKKTREILGFSVGKIAAKNRLSIIGKTRYGWTSADSALCFGNAMAAAKFALKPMLTVMTDRHASYPCWLSRALPGSCYTHVKAKPIRHKVGARKPFDRLFSVNKVCAHIRRDLAVMRRDTSVTNKNMDRLAEKLWVYLAFHNGYKMGLLASTRKYIT